MSQVKDEVDFSNRANQLLKKLTPDNYVHITAELQKEIEQLS